MRKRKKKINSFEGYTNQKKVVNALHEISEKGKQTRNRCDIEKLVFAKVYAREISWLLSSLYHLFSFFRLENWNNWFKTITFCWKLIISMIFILTTQKFMTLTIWFRLIPESSFLVERVSSCHLRKLIPQIWCFFRVKLSDFSKSLNSQVSVNLKMAHFKSVIKWEQITL